MDNRQEFIDKLSKLSKEEMLERYVALLDSEKLTDYVADLETKLVESEKKYNDTKELGVEQFHSLKEIINSSQEEINQLKQQLAEKEKEETKRMEDFEKRCQEYYSTEEYKRDFAIAKLEKVKQEFNGALSISIQQEMFDKYIDQQIKSLKGEK